MTTTRPLRTVGLAMIVAITACKADPPTASLRPLDRVPLARVPSAQRSDAEQVRMTAAALFTERYERSRFAEWNVRGRATGPQCIVLFVDVDVIMEESMVEAMHYGTGPYAIAEGSVQHFYRDRSFRGVAYRDASKRIWTYGAVSVQEAAALAPCQ